MARGKKIIPPYHQLKRESDEGIITRQPMELLGYYPNTDFQNNQGRNSGITATPYSKMIPLYYLEAVTNSYGSFPQVPYETTSQTRLANISGALFGEQVKENAAIVPHFNKWMAENNPELTRICMSSYHNRSVNSNGIGLLGDKEMILDSNKQGAKNIINNYLFFDRPFDVSSHGIHNYIHTVDNLIRNFFTMKRCHFGMRTYSGYVGHFSMYINESGAASAQIIAVILQENLIYQKLHIVKYGCIDLTKVVILVNSDIDNTSYPHKPFRTLYKKFIEPEFKKYGFDVWKVPKSFIDENCFMKPYQLKSKSLPRREAEINSIIDKFIDETGRDSSTIATQVLTATDGSNLTWTYHGRNSETLEQQSFVGYNTPVTADFGQQELISSLRNYGNTIQYSTHSFQVALDQLNSLGIVSTNAIETVSADLPEEAFVDSEEFNSLPGLDDDEGDEEYWETEPERGDNDDNEEEVNLPF